MGGMKSSSRANNMASLVVKRGCLHCGPGKVGILGEYLLSSLSALFLGRFSSNTDHFEAGDLYFTMGRMKSSSRANNMASVVVKRGRLHYGPAYNAGAKLEFGPYASNYLITGLACLAIYCFMYM